MPSIVSGFEYDIFISYRHNDNLDGWVTEFVQSLEKELKATLKDNLSIYFDRNPHDGLLETHSVDKSLEGKLKCLIFIPIISQTYCDTKSFAWQHEFCAFNKLSKEDQFGRDIKLSNGNIAGRILPIKIHDLDAEDKVSIENEIGGVLRAIEFIYKEPGVNRPLLSGDSVDKNLNKTIYRNQINKVANAIKEIIGVLKNPAPKKLSARAYQPTTDSSKTKAKLIIVAVALLLLIVAGYFLYPKSNTPIKSIGTLDKSVAVLPFIDLSEAKDQGWFSDGLTEEILNSLAHINGLNVISRTSSFAFKNKNLRIETIADSLHVNYIVEGSVRKSNQGFRITAQLIRASDGYHLWSNTYNRNSKDIFILQQEIATKIAESLDISLDPKAIAQMQSAGTNNPEAFIAFLKGQEIFTQAHNKWSELLPLLRKANFYFEETTRLDSDFVNPYLYSGDFYFHFLTKTENTVYRDTITNAQAYQLVKKSIENAVDKSKSEIDKDYYQLYSIMWSNDWSSIRPLAERVLKSEDAPQLFRSQPFDLSNLLTCMGYAKEMERILRAILEKDPLNSNMKKDLSELFIVSGNYKRAIEVIDSMNTLQGDLWLNYNKVICLYQLKKFEEAASLIMKWDSSNVFTYHSTKAMLLARLGKTEEAKANHEFR